MKWEKKEENWHKNMKIDILSSVCHISKRESSQFVQSLVSSLDC